LHNQLFLFVQASAGADEAGFPDHFGRRQLGRRHLREYLPHVAAEGELQKQPDGRDQGSVIPTVHIMPAVPNRTISPQKRR
jgi:hypothetical protein